ncbi:C-type lectin domain-containing protein [Caenorhabditis elegans]|uniref:C-type lectin domain-containing protein n=1 Tax=Caenorhabditis elegans TaxID=6239 RepID=Q7JK99_CAEEL|nr:C-type lectin domain-containing protein [Caenorhabditis elegans]CAE54926.2 C-type lectin domain-containing protein [Caenorhabditis elegans]
MHPKCGIILLSLIFICITEIESRKVTQKPAAPPPPKNDKSWVRSKIDSAKEKYHAGKEKLKTKISDVKSKLRGPAPTPQPRPPAQNNLPKSQYGWNTQAPGPRAPAPAPTRPQYGVPAPRAPQPTIPALTTKKSVFERLKEKAKGKEKYVGKAVGWAKKDLGIGVEGPKKPSKILKFGKKAVDFMFKKKTPKTQNPALVHSSGQIVGQVASGSHGLDRKVEYLKSRLDIMQSEIQGTWNTSESGTKYKIFEERMNWNDAQLHCEELGSHLAYLDSESKNTYATSLIDSQNISMVWFGLRTEVGLGSGSDTYSNFSNLDGCGVVDRNGTWSISSCAIELPYLCQAFRFNVLVEIP